MRSSREAADFTAVLAVTGFLRIGSLLAAAEQDWGAVEPAILGTLFERSLDPDKRAQIGAHYTSRDDIMLIVEPVVMAADITLIAPEQDWTVDAESLKSLSRNTPFDGWKLRGRAVMTMVGGRERYRDPDRGLNAVRAPAAVR